MDQFLSVIHENWTTIDHPTLLPAYALWRLNWIHPFIEGNGRTARAACYYLICLRNGGLLPGIKIVPEQAVYAGTKHAVLGFTRAVAAEVAGSGVTANCVCPAYVRSDMTDATIANIESRTGKDGEEALAAMTPLGRLIEPAEVAFAVRFFASEEAGAINGQSLIMDGGGVQQ